MQDVPRQHVQIAGRFTFNLDQGLEGPLLNKIVVSKHHRQIVRLARWHWQIILDPTTSANAVKYHQRVMRRLLDRLPDKRIRVFPKWS